jgi:hypothetical protein
VRITDVTVALHDRTSPTPDVFGVPDGRLPMGVLSIRTDEGWKGYKVHPARAPEGPGLGVDVDWDLIASAGLGEVA